MKKARLMAILVALIVISGCAQMPGRRKEPEPAYRQGSQGIVMRFLPNYPRSPMYDDQPFDVLLEVRNMGSYDVGFPGDKIYLSGFDNKIITGIPQMGAQIPKMEGIGPYNPEGGFDTVEFKGTIYPLKLKNIDKYPATILATACYGYKTIASNNICIDPDPYGATSERKVCVPSAVSFGTQGAPVAVTSVDVDAAPRVTRFKIQISNAGGGTVLKYGPDYLARCSPYHTRGLEFNEVDSVRLSKVEVAGKVITPSCKPVDNDGSVRLINGQATVFCELVGLGSGPAYQTPLTVELDYSYRSTISKSVEIVQIPG